MTSVRRLDHVGLLVEDLLGAVEFYEGVFGLVEMHRDNGSVHLGCGLDDNVDLVVSEGGTGVDHYAVRAGDRSVRAYEQLLADRGVEVTHGDEEAPGEPRSIQFELPSGEFTMEIVDVDDARYHNPANVETLPTAARVHGDRSPIAPRDLDHIGLYSSDIEADVTFLRDVLGFRISDIALTGNGDWKMVFVRAGQHHHDIVVFDEPGEATLGHLAWDMNGLGHLQQLADHLTANGYQLETPIVRHGPGANISTYFVAPGGNRFEVTTGVATVDTGAEVRTHDLPSMPFCVWSDVRPPESFFVGS